MKRTKRVLGLALAAVMCMGLLRNPQQQRHRR